MDVVGDEEHRVVRKGQGQSEVEGAWDIEDQDQDDELGAFLREGLAAESQGDIHWVGPSRPFSSYS
jgi:hypothetical protein